MANELSGLWRILGRGGVLTGIVVIVFLLPTASFGLAGAPSQNTKPNILILLSDDQASNTMGCMGNPVVQTPNLDRLARQGILFRNAFVTTSVCSVSRASLLTGQYASRHGIENFSDSLSLAALSQTYPSLLKDGGYYTGFIGKWGVDPRNKSGMAMVAESFDYWAGASHQANYWHQKRCRYVRHNGIRKKQDGICDCPSAGRGKSGPRPRTGRAYLSEPLHLTTEIIPDKAEQFLRSRDVNRPFCLSISFKAPHGPLEDFSPQLAKMYEDSVMPMSRTATPELADDLPRFLQSTLSGKRGRAYVSNRKIRGRLQRQLRHYYRHITGLDLAVGRILGRLSTLNLDGNTVIIFCSDNGMMFGEHGLGGKWLMYEESIRVPMIVYDPRVISLGPDRISDEMVLNIDVAPTIMEFAGFNAPLSMQGQSMVSLLTEPSMAFREDWFYEHHALSDHIPASEGVRTRNWKYMRFINEDPIYEALYDLESDPQETQNLASLKQYNHILSNMRAKCAQLKQAVR